VIPGELLLQDASPGYLRLGTLQLALAAALILVNGGISVALRLGMERDLGIAAVRTVVQLALVGLVLEWVFDLREPTVVMLLCLFMITAAAVAAARRPGSGYRGIYRDSFVSMLVSSLLVTLVAVVGILSVEPWYEPQYLIPLLGMLLGNSLTGISLGLDRLLSDLRSARQVVEARLTLGATAWEAARPAVREAVRTGMIPIVNTMTVVGIVSLPGMMTGQILAGADPVDAVKYQILILFMIAASTALGTLGAVLLGYRRLFDHRDRLRDERIRPRA
jgi:putative ABC transport system permease protein